MQYTNPRTQCTINDWPSGRHRTTATFRIETHPTRGERVVRTTLHPKTGRPSAPKTTTYARRVRIVDGDDGRTYLVEDTGTHLTVRQGNMQYEQETLWPRDPRYSTLLALFDEGATR